MALKCILFDLYGTLVDVETDESMIEIYRAIGHFLTYHGVDIRREALRDLYFSVMKRQRQSSPEEHPEIDVDAIWNEVLTLRHATVTPGLPREVLARLLAQLHRGISRRRLALYPGVLGALDALRGRFSLGLVSDAQPCFTPGEISAVGLDGYFREVVLSGALGYRKPDPRMFTRALAALGARPDEAIFVGNDMFRDVFGAQQAGLEAIFYASNQGTQTHEGTTPDRVARTWDEVQLLIEELARD